MTAPAVSDDVLVDAKRWLNKGVPRGQNTTPDYWAGVTLIRRLSAELSTAREVALTMHRELEKLRNTEVAPTPVLSPDVRFLRDLFGADLVARKQGGGFYVPRFMRNKVLKLIGNARRRWARSNMHRSDSRRSTRVGRGKA